MVWFRMLFTQVLSVSDCDDVSHADGPHLLPGLKRRFEFGGKCTAEAIHSGIDHVLNLDAAWTELHILMKGLLPIGKRYLNCVLEYCLLDGINGWVPSNFIEIIDRKLQVNDLCGLLMFKTCIRLDLLKQAL